MKWWEETLVCDECHRTTYRPSRAGTCAPETLPDESGEWPCQGTLRAETEAEGVERRRAVAEEWTA